MVAKTRGTARTGMIELDEIEMFQCATCYIEREDYKGALPFLEAAAPVMSGYSEFDALLASVRAKASTD